MKTTFALGLALLALAPARAQIFRPEAVDGAVLGGIAGAIIGHNSGDLRHNGWKGAAIGAGAGLLLGQIIGEGRVDRGYERAGTRGQYGGQYVYRTAPRVEVSYGRGYGYYPGSRFGSVHRGGRGYYGSSRGFGVRLSYPLNYGVYPDYAGGEYIYAASAPQVLTMPAAAAAPQTQAVPQQVTIINNYYNTPATPMSAANGLFGR